MQMNDPHAYLRGLMQPGATDRRVLVRTHSRALPGGSPASQGGASPNVGRHQPRAVSTKGGQTGADAQCYNGKPTGRPPKTGNPQGYLGHFAGRAVLRAGHNTTAKTFHGKSLKPGGGGRFAKFEAAVAGKVRNPAAVAAAAGRAKYGKAKFQAMAAKGRARAAHQRAAQG